MSNDPSQTIAAVDAMREDWAVVAPLMGGTKGMRAAGERLLPKFPKEEDDEYKARLNQSTLLPAYSETVGNMTDRVFAEPLQVGDDVPDAIRELTDDVDLAGNDINNWSVGCFKAGLADGLVHAWVESPKADGVRTMADEKKANIRPYLVLVLGLQVLGWRVKNGQLDMVRYRETIEEDDGEFGIKQIEQIRVLRPGSWATYRQVKKGGTWAMHEEGTNSLGRIPWATFYTGRTGFMTAKPPLLELAHLNIKHWQSQSDQDNILHVARVPMLMVSGIDDESWELKVGTSSATKLPNGGDMKWVEHTGKAIEAGRQSLQDLIDEMRMAGAKLLQKDKQQTKTATQAEEESAQELSPLARMAGQFADFLAQLLQYMGEYRGVTDGGHVEMRGNFDQDYAPEVSLPQLLSMANAGKLSDETLFAEFQRRGVISDEYSWDEERDRISEQGPAPGLIGGLNGNS